MKILAKLERSRECWIFICLSVLFFLLRIPSLFEPHWYGDEGIYQVLGLAIRNGRILYSQIWDNKPPFLYLTYALFNSDQFLVRSASLIAGLLSLWFFYLLAKQIFTNSKVILWTTTLFALLFGLPFLEGNIANSENFMMAPTLLAGYLLVKYGVRKNILFTLGILLAVSFLFKVVAIFDFAAFMIFALFIGLKNIDVIKFLKITTPAIVGFLLLIIPVFAYFFLNHALSNFISASFKQNVGYVGYGNTFIIPQGFLILKLTLLSLFLFFLLRRKHTLSPQTLFIFIWLAFCIFNAFFSQRPYTHYVLVLLPSLCLYIGLLPWNRLLNKKTLQPFHLTAFAVLLILLLLLGKNFNFYGKTVFYYQNFLQYILGNKSTENYYAFFDRNTPKDYAIAQYIKRHTTNSDTIFIWGNDAQVYALVHKLPPGRFTVAYHMIATPQTLEETRNDVVRTKPKYIVISSSDDPLPYSLNGYTQKIVIDNSIIYERIY